MPASRPICFYDGNCPICRREIAHYQRLDHAGAVDWRNIGESDAALAGTGIDHAAALQRLHVIAADGAIHTGADAFTLIWHQLPRWRWLARCIKWLRLRPLLGWAYDFWASRRATRLAACGNLVCERPPQNHATGQERSS